MHAADDEPWAGRWKFAVWLIVICWVLSMLSVLSWLILPLLGFAVWRTSRRGAWKPAACILLANPLGFWFMEGAVDYAGGAPTIRRMGLPSMESFNIDPLTRAFPRTGGCLVTGNEWVSQDSHNLGVLAMRSLFGPPSRSYDGPYPTKQEALHAVSAAPDQDIKEFFSGRIKVQGKSVELGRNMAEDISSSLRIMSMFDPDSLDELIKCRVQSVVYKDRCLILRIRETGLTTSEPEEREFLILIDMKNLRPFAYYRIKGDGVSRYPKAQYLPEHSR